MKIALVHEYLTTFAGSEQVLLALHEMFPEAPIFTAMYYPEKVPQFRNADVRTSFLQKFPRAKEKVYIPLLPLANEGYDLSEFDLVISDSHIAAKGVITKPNTIHICYCHTPIRYAWSPEVDPRASGSPLRRFANHYLRLWDTYAAKRVDYWIANSDFIASRIKKYYRAEATVINPPVDVNALQPDPDATVEDYYVLFTRLIDYKFPDLAIKAFNKLGKKLIILGRGPMLEELQAMAGPNIEFITEFLPYSKIAQLFSRASAMVFPAEEDFGIAMVDMLACGRPVIAYGIGGATEIVLPGKTGELFYEQTPEAIEQAVASFDPMRYDKKVIRAHAETFDRQVFEKKMRAFIEEVTAKKGK
jgi:glycosyltransferase involved in cell wall biosynthesis